MTTTYWTFNIHITKVIFETTTTCSTI